MPEEILTVREVAEFLKVTERTIYRLATEGQIPSFKVGGSWRFQRSDLIRWMHEQAKGQAERGHGQPKGERVRMLPHVDLSLAPSSPSQPSECPARLHSR